MTTASIKPISDTLGLGDILATLPPATVMIGSFRPDQKSKSVVFAYGLIQGELHVAYASAPGLATGPAQQEVAAELLAAQDLFSNIQIVPLAEPRRIRKIAPTYEGKEAAAFRKLNSKLYGRKVTFTELPEMRRMSQAAGNAIVQAGLLDTKASDDIAVPDVPAPVDAKMEIPETAGVERPQAGPCWAAELAAKKDAELADVEEQSVDDELDVEAAADKSQDIADAGAVGVVTSEAEAEAEAEPEAKVVEIAPIPERKVEQEAPEKDTKANLPDLDVINEQLAAAKQLDEMSARAPDSSARRGMKVRLAIYGLLIVAVGFSLLQ